MLRVPGVGVITVAGLLAEAGDQSTYEQSHSGVSKSHTTLKRHRDPFSRLNYLLRNHESTRVQPYEGLQPTNEARRGRYDYPSRAMTLQRILTGLRPSTDRTMA